MVSFESAINQTLCKINDNLTQLKFLEQARNVRENNIYFFTVPENGGTRVFTAGTTKVDFLVGNIIKPDGSTERLQHSLQNYKLEFVHSLSIDTNQNIIIKINDSPKRTITADFSTQIPWLTFNFIEIECTVDTNIALFACTNPQAVIGQFKQTTVNILEQDSINGDGTEAQTNDAIVNLKNNLNRIRYNIVTITGEAWGTVSHSIAAVWAKFHATTGHKHTGAADDAPNLAGTVITNTPSGTIAATTVQAALNELDTEKETPAAAQTKVDTHAALTTGVHGVAGAVVVGTTTTQDISNKRLVDITIKDTDATPEADRMLRVTDGVPKFRDTGDTVDIPVDNADKLDTKHYSDIATEIDTDIATHAALTAAGTHGSTAAATASKIMIRDAAGRCSVVAPSALTDIALRSTVIDNITAHASDTSTHGVSVVDGVTERDAAIATHAALTASHGQATIEGIAGSQAKVDTHAALTTTHGGALQTAAMKNVASGIAGLDAQVRSARSQLPSICRSGFWGSVALADLTVYQGAWGTADLAGQTDYDDLLVPAAGYYGNAGGNLDLVYLGPLTLNAGTYVIKVAVATFAEGGILEVLHASTSLGTFDTYSASVTYNVIATFNYSPTTRISQYLNFRVNGKNASSTGYRLIISRIEIRKTA